MANPNPVQTDAFKAQQVPKHGEVALSRKVIGTRYPVEVEQILAQIPDHQSYIRRAVIEALLQDGLLTIDRES